MTELDIVVLLAAAMFAGFVDAVAGGGGLIQVPALLGTLPEVATATLFGTNKISSVFGTASAAWRYLRQVAVPWAIVLPAAIAAFCFAFLGAACVAFFPPAVVRPLVFWLLIAVVIYTLLQPRMGVVVATKSPVRSPVVVGVGVGGVIGFYDGFFGPGTGSFLIFAFVGFFGWSFLQASVSAKVVNLATNCAALCYFVPAGNVLFGIGLGMAVGNVLGAQVGSRFALRGGNAWIRVVFLLMSGLLIGKVGWDIWG